MPSVTKTPKEAMFRDLAESLQKAFEKPMSQEQKVHAALDLVEGLLERSEGLDLSRFEPCTSHYARHLVYRDPQDRFSLMVLVWRPGQGTPIHDHDGTWGVYGVLRNKMRFTNYIQESSGGKPRLAVLCSTVAAAGSATIVLPPHCDIHRMENPTAEETSYTLHCYGKEVKAFQIFQPDGGGKRTHSPSYDSTPC